MGGGGGRFLALTKSTEARSRDLLVKRLGDLAIKPGFRLTAGIGPMATAAQETHRAIRHALVAFQWAELSAASEGAVVRYEDVAHLRLLPCSALGVSTEIKHLLAAFASIVRYDVDSGADLGQTLEAFLANAGSVAKTSSQLFIHRNTLRQRIQRIEELIGQSPEEFEDWITAGFAARLIRQSEAELGRHGGPRAGRCPHGVLTVGRFCCEMPNSCTLSDVGP